MIVPRFLLLFFALFGVDPGTGANAEPDRRIQETSNPEKVISEEKNDEKPDNFLVKTFLSETTKFDDFYLKNMAEVHSKNRFSMAFDKCVDEELYDECFSLCRVSYFQCKANCDSASCDTACISEFAECTASCPCGDYCPDGCAGCVNEICGDECENAETENLDFINCREIALENQASCIRQCPAEKACFEKCNLALLEELDECPCVQTATTTTAVPTTQQPSDLSEIFILVVLESISDSYVISGDGNSKVSARISAPADDYAYMAQHALIGDQLFIFGGYSDYRKIAVLEGCSFVEKSSRLRNDIDEGSAALSIDGGFRVLICFSDGSNANYCEIYDGTSSTSTTSTYYGHPWGKLGFYKNQPTTVGCTPGYSEPKKVETLTNNGWTVIGDPPSDISFHALVGLESGNLLMLGGAGKGNRLDDVWLLSNDSWLRTGSLKSAVSEHSLLRINDSIFLFAGVGGSYPIQRVDMVGDEIKSSEIIANHNSWEFVPVLFQASAGFCA